jgi:8-oxo-dGTP pyrophosphatase MutT (NUDIX family)
MMTDKNPYHITSQKLVYKTPWIGIREDIIVHPDGRPGIYSVVELPGFAIILPMTNDGQIYFVRLWRYPIAAFSWELPMGRLDDGEDPQQAAERGLAEETGLMAATWQKLGRVSSMNGVANNYGTAFVAQGVKSIDGPRDSEVEQVQTFSLAEVYLMVKQGTIHDAETLAVLCLAMTQGIIKP